LLPQTGQTSVGFLEDIHPTILAPHVQSFGSVSN
jgi:hypothetical protein